MLPYADGQEKEEKGIRAEYDLVAGQNADDFEFDDMLADFRVSDLATASAGSSGTITTTTTSRSSTASMLATSTASSSSSNMKVEEQSPAGLSPNSAPGVTALCIQVGSIRAACRRNDMGQLRKWSRQGFCCSERN
jgi:hypothetical protein